METLFNIAKIITILITGYEMWKANDERNLGFTVFWALASLFLIFIFAN